MQLISLLLLFFLASCSNDLTEKDATRLIDEHIRAVYPAEIADSTLLKIKIKEILTPDDNNREVRFNLRFETENTRYDDKLNDVWSDTLIVYFQKSNHGRTLRTYGEESKNYFADLWSAQLFADYQPLVETLITLRLQTLSWIKSRGFTVMISEDQLRQIMSQTAEKLSPDVVWGIYPGKYVNDVKRSSSILWVRLAKDSTVVCGQVMGLATRHDDIPKVFFWLGDGAFRLICEGRASRFDSDRLTAKKAGLDVIKKNGGRLPPHRMH